MKFRYKKYVSDILRPVISIELIYEAPRMKPWHLLIQLHIKALKLTLGTKVPRGKTIHPRVNSWFSRFDDKHHVLPYEVLVDSGADANIFDVQIADILGVNLLSGKTARVSGIMSKWDFLSKLVNAVME